MADFSKVDLELKYHDRYDELIRLGQGHLFDDWRSEDDASDRKAFFEQIDEFEEYYGKGLADYLENAKRLLADSKNGVTPYQGCVPTTPSVEKQLDVENRRGEFQDMERAGMGQIGDAAFVLVAGGLGERLGEKRRDSPPKALLPIETTTRMTYLEYYIRFILAFQSRARRQRNDDTLTLPLAIMTSDGTYPEIQRRLEDECHFGMEADQVTLLLQKDVPCLNDNDAHLVTEDCNPYRLLAKPHGHGDVHRLLYTSGLPKAWSFAGKKWVLFFQDTNGLSFRGFPAALGVSEAETLQMNFLAVPRTPKEAIGVIVELTPPNQRSPVNIEYNELERLLLATGHPQGDVAGDSEFSPFPGNINILVLELSTYCSTLERTEGKICEMVNPKYADKARERFKKPTRLECLMQDYAKELAPDAKVGVTRMDRWLVFSPVKNSLENAKSLAKKGLPPESAGSGEMDIYRATAQLLRLSGENEIASEKIQRLGEIDLPVNPRIVYSPEFAVTVEELLNKVRGLKVTHGSTLVIDGEDIEIENLILDGTLKVKASEGEAVQVRQRQIHNPGWPIGDLPDNPSYEDEIRGYRINTDDQRATVLEE